MFVTISLRSGYLRCRGGLRIIPERTITRDGPAPEVAVVPGGIVDNQAKCETTIQWLRDVANQGKMVSSVCNGALILAAAGLLNGRRATTHWEDIELLRESAPAAVVSEGCRFVDDGNVVTSGGVTAGIDMSLHLIRRFYGSDHASITARQMDYVWSG
jgi:transcriptional regulator GlxA family with amidase domain